MTQPPGRWVRMGLHSRGQKGLPNELSTRYPRPGFCCVHRHGGDTVTLTGQAESRI